MGGYPSTVEGTRIQPSKIEDSAANKNRPNVVLVPVDSSKQAEVAFEWYVRHIHQPDNIVRVIHCQELHNPSMFYDLKQNTIEESVHNAKEQGCLLINKYEGKLRQHQISGSVHAEFGPSPGEVVLTAADKFRVSHIVMGSRGLGPIRRTILGSVSTYVIHHTRVPVTIVPRDSNDRSSIF